MNLGVFIRVLEGNGNRKGVGGVERRASPGQDWYEGIKDLI